MPDDALLALVGILRTVPKGSLDPVTGEEIDAESADVLADALEVAAETGAPGLGMDDRDRPLFRWVLENWPEERGAIPEWAKELGASPKMG